jgi:hypothetical protein
MTIETAKEYIKHRARPRYTKYYDESAVVETTMRSKWIVHNFGLSVEHDLNLIYDVARAWLTSTHEERIANCKATTYDEWLKNPNSDFIMVRDGHRIEVQRVNDITEIAKTHTFEGMSTLGTMPIFRKQV